MATASAHITPRHLDRASQRINMDITGLPADLTTALLKSLMDQGSEGLIYADQAGAIRVWNTGCEKIFGHSAEEALGQSLDIIIPEKLRAAHWKGFNAALETGTLKYKDHVMTTRAVHKDGSTRYVDLSFFMVSDAQGKSIGSMSVARDCTERYLKDRELKAKLMELEQGGQAAPKA
jgi:PAS domain S-box-containing protein